MGKALELPESLRISIAKSLFHVTRTDENRNELNGLCPIHGEKNPSFSYNYVKDVYTCSTGSCMASGDLIKLWILVRGFSSSKEGFVSFCREYGLGDGNSRSEYPHNNAHASDKAKETPVAQKKPLKDLTSIFRQMPTLPADWIRELKKTKGWSEEIIRKYDLRLQTKYQAKGGPVRDAFWKPDRLAIPVYENGVMVNMRLYRPGPAKDGKRGADKIISWASGSGDARLFPAEPDPEGVVLLCEGESDTICARSNDLNGITQTSKPKKWLDEHLDKFRDRDVVIAFDADLAGQIYAREFAAPEIAQVAKSVKLLEWPDYMGRLDSGEWPNDHGQDLTDFFVKHRKSKADLEALIAEAMPFNDSPSEIHEETISFFSRGPSGRLSFKPSLLAEKLLRDDKIILDPENDQLYRWNGHFWEKIKDKYLINKGIRYLGEEASKNKVADAVYVAINKSQMPYGRQMNDKDDWVCLKNGMFNLRTCELIGHDADFLASYEIPIIYDPESDRRCDQWLKFLEGTIQDEQTLLQFQEYYGYCLTRETFAEKALLLLGSGSNGKSKAFSVLKALVGRDNYSSVQIGDLHKEFSRSQLYGKLVNIASENARKPLDSTDVKAIISGDTINAAFKYGDGFSYDPYCKLVFSMNELPRVLDNTEGFFRKILPIEFKAEFAEHDPRKDPFLDKKLLSEISEIFQWAVAGLLRLREQGHFTYSDATRDMIMDYKRDNNPVLCFLEERCDVGEAYNESKDKIFEAYKSYCFKNNYQALGLRRFWAEMWIAQKNLKKYRPRLNGGRDRYILGIGLKAEVNS